MTDCFHVWHVDYQSDAELRCVHCGKLIVGILSKVDKALTTIENENANPFLWKEIETIREYVGGKGEGL